MEFKQFNSLVQKNFKEMTSGNEQLFVLDVDNEELWEYYLDSFPEGTNPIYRERREYDCSCCRHFLRDMGAVVALSENGTMRTIWDVDTSNTTFQAVIESMKKYLEGRKIAYNFLTDTETKGTKTSHERNEDGTVTTWSHFYIDEFPRDCRVSSHSITSSIGTAKTNQKVMLRSLQTITIDSVQTVLELIAQNSLYRGQEFKPLLDKFLKAKVTFDRLDDETTQHNFAWQISLNDPAMSRMRNISIGTLLVDISNGVELNGAVTAYEKIMAPENYKRPNAIYTKKMVEEAAKKVKELGFEKSLGRRFATLDDIKINNVLFANRNVKSNLESGNVFDDLMKEVTVNPKSFAQVNEINIDDFLENVLPTAEEISVLVENRHRNNFVSLIAPTEDGKSMLKWNNNFSWGYRGNITDSSMKENVKLAGGQVEGVMRFSIQWNTEEHDNVDFDAHCVELKGSALNSEIYYGNKRGITGGQLDVDIINPINGVPAVENIIWENSNKLVDGEYVFYVHNFDVQQSKYGFTAEIEINGEIFEYQHDQKLRGREKVVVGTVVCKNGELSLIEGKKGVVRSSTIWNINTQQFVPVSVIMNSPNYWDGQSGIGNRHVFFMLEDCISEETPNGFFNEFLHPSLNEQKRVFEAMGAKMAVLPSDNQLSGIGFSTTQRNTVTVKVKGKTERVLKVKF